MIVKFLGVGGSCSVSKPSRTRYGSNTSTVLIKTRNRPLIIDMGTGMALLREVNEADILISHFHYDHIEGMPFFSPFYYGKIHKIIPL